MKALKFTLSGKTAFFKRPEVNTNYYFTFGNIHKVALLGIFGAILGYQGYNATKDKGLPEFYQKLHDLKISIIPRNKNGYISKKIQYFNNSVGYASNELGGNLIVKEQWLENPIWDIVVLLDCQEADMLALSLLNNTCIYIPYLGKNDHPANISNVEIIELTEKKINE
ncbi:MAG TPA: type I-B CRISPR-associated protein Cas5b, partial [[Clostridium] spiroforme]|nr:type I-B CRISPR-associated protein Cas5b [Thomasclavelia spiroformis]